MLADYKINETITVQLASEH